MIPNLSPYLVWSFALTTLITLVLFIRMINRTKATSPSGTGILITFLLWLALQAALSLNNSYNTRSMPPKLVLWGILPGLILIIAAFATSKGRAFIDTLPIKDLTFLNIIRIPVELILLWLYLEKAVPELMTFEGRNYDILAGLTAPIVAYYIHKIGRTGLLIWNLACLALLLNIVINAFLSAPTPLQRFAFQQPDIAILNFPFSWLPTFVVPIVLFGHLASIRQLIKKSPIK